MFRRAVSGYSLGCSKGIRVCLCTFSMEREWQLMDSLTLRIGRAYSLEEMDGAAMACVGDGVADKGRGGPNCKCSGRRIDGRGIFRGVSIEVQFFSRVNYRDPFAPEDGLV